MPRNDSRVRTNASEGRASRAAADLPRTDDEGTALTVSERSAQIRSEFAQTALPDVPPIPGWHLCWLSTTSSYDPIHKRMRLGYVPVKPEELVARSGIGFDTMGMKSGEFAGCVSCNEMVLFKIPEDTYQAIMREFHHNMPQEEEEALKSQLVPNVEDSNGAQLVNLAEDDTGFKGLVQKRRVPVF